MGRKVKGYYMKRIGEETTGKRTSRKSQSEVSREARMRKQKYFEMLEQTCNVQTKRILDL